MLIKTLSEHLLMATLTDSLRPPTACFRGKAELFWPCSTLSPGANTSEAYFKTHMLQLARSSVR